MSIVDELEHRMTLTSAVARYESLRRRDSLVEFSEADQHGGVLGHGETLELQALGVTRQSAWEGHTRWIDAQAAQHQVNDYEGLDHVAADEARRRAGFPDE